MAERKLVVGGPKEEAVEEVRVVLKQDGDRLQLRLEEVVNAPLILALELTERGKIELLRYGFVNKEYVESENNHIRIRDI